MRARALIATVAALAGATAAAFGQDPPATPPLQAGLTACQTGPNPADRFAVFTGSMPTVEGATTLAMRFDLYQKLGDGDFRRLTIPHWGIWAHTSKKGVPGFIFTKRVDGLGAPGAYRAEVAFKWTDATGKVIQKAKRDSPVCDQPDPRPDLAVGRLTVKAITQRTARYTVVVRNIGRGDAPSFTVALAGTRKQAGALSAGTSEKVTVRAPRCGPGDRVLVSVDSTNVVNEARNPNNIKSFACPLGRA